MDVDWAHVESLVAAPIDLAAAGRAYTPPVIPASKMMATGGRGGGASKQAGAQVLAVKPGQGGGRAGGVGGMKGRTRMGSGSGAVPAIGGVPVAGTVPAAGHQEEMLDLVYDPVLNCYYDQKTNRYFELK